MEELLNVQIVNIPLITAAVYYLMELIKKKTNGNKSVKRNLPLLAAFMGMLFGILICLYPCGISISDNIVVSAVVGAGSGLSATGIHQVIKQKQNPTEEKEDGERSQKTEK